jgi:hypothetical protein
VRKELVLHPKLISRVFKITMRQRGSIEQELACMTAAAVENTNETLTTLAGYCRKLSIAYYALSADIGRYSGYCFPDGAASYVFSVNVEAHGFSMSLIRAKETCVVTVQVADLFLAPFMM